MNDRKVNRPIVLPDYYQKPFHAYKHGNLCWESAMEVEAGTYAPLTTVRACVRDSASTPCSFFGRQARALKVTRRMLTRVRTHTIARIQAAYAVHSNLFTGSTKTLEKEGDSKLRGNFHDRMIDMLREYNFRPRRILDVGCSTGLSTLKLHATSPDAEIVGVDLSPHMLSVARYNLRNRPEQAEVRFQREVHYV